MSRRPVIIEWQGQRRPRRDVIHELHEAGVETAEIARRLGVRYQIVYTTTVGSRAAGAGPSETSAPAALDLGPVDAVLLGCVKWKDARARDPRRISTPELFRRWRLYAEASALPWWIVRAEYGLVAPDEVIAPYDTLMGARPLQERR